MRRSKGKYPPDWPAIAQAVKDAAGWRCVRCDHPHEVETGFVLTVHHLDLNPANCRWWNLAALCQRCHLRIQAKVVLERPWLFEHTDWFVPYVAGYYAHTFGLELTREEVIAQAEDLILRGQGRVPRVASSATIPAGATGPGPS
jgi:hypothetical protein